MEKTRVARPKDHPHMRTAEEIEALIGTEEKARRTENAKLFSLGDNLYQTVLYAQPVHYLDGETGAWEEIDNTLVEEKDSLGQTRLVNRRNGLMSVALSTGQRMVEIKNGQGETVSWVLEGAGAKAVTMDKAAARRLEAADINYRNEVQTRLAQDAIYKDILPGTQMHCHIESTTFKEDIVFATREAAKPLSFLITAPALSLVLNGDQSISLYNAEKALAFEMPAPFMIDDGGMTGGVSVTLAEEGDGRWRLTYAPDDAWLDAAAFPVTLDPAIYVAKHNEWGYVSDKAPTTAYPNGTRLVTNMQGHKRMLYFRFGKKTGEDSKLPALDASYAVSSAVLHMPASRSGVGEAGPLYLREVLADWNPKTLTHAHQPSVSDLDIDMAQPTTSGRNIYQFNIARLAQKWHTGWNYGVVIDARMEGVDIVAEAPYLVINYASQAGLEEYYTYESHSIGRAGTAHVNLFNGNLVFEHADTSTNGSRLPVSISHYYNACYRDLDIFSAGFGWKHSMHNSMHYESYAPVTGAGTHNYVFTDKDGTRHNFIRSTKADPQRGTTFEDTSGLSLRIHVGVAPAAALTTIFDKADTKTRFTAAPGSSNGRNMSYVLMREIEDANGNKIAVETGTIKPTGKTVTYPIVKSVTDGAGRKTTLTHGEENGYVTSIKAPGYGETGLAFAYDDKGRLTEITYEDGLKTLFTYDDNNLITSATNHDGRKLTIEYEPYAPYRVKRITESAGEMAGNCREYAYDYLKTTVTDRTVPGGKKLHLMFNMAGNLITAHDLLGHAMVAKFTPEEKPNQPKSVSKRMRAVVNLLRNHSFETGKHWLLAGPARFDTQDPRLGERCLCFDGGMDGAAMQASQTLTLTPGKEYALSFYAKCCGPMALCLAMEYQDEDGVKHTVESPVLSGAPVYEYERFFHVFRLPYGSAKAVTLQLRGQGQAGTPSRAWIDCAQLEEGVLPNRYNMAVNGDFSHTCADDSNAWIANADTPQDDLAYLSEDMLDKPEGMTQHVLRLHGAAERKAGYYQEIAASGQAGDVYLLGGWANAFSLSDPANSKAFGLHLEFKNEDGEYIDPTEKKDDAASDASAPAGGVAWARQWMGWQFTCGACVAGENYTAIRLCIDYENNINTAEFDGIFLHREHFGRSFDYDDKGNLIALETLTGKRSESEYDDFDNLIQYRSPGHPKSEFFRMDYGETDADKKKHLLYRSISPSGMTQQHTYDAKGNRLSTLHTGPNTADFIKGEVAYNPEVKDDDEKNYPFNYVTETTDARGLKATQDVDVVLGVTKSTTNAAGTVTENTHDLLRRLTGTSTTVDERTYRNAYTYTDGKLTSVAHNTGFDDACDVAYHFEYDALGNRTRTKVGEQLLSESFYSESGDKLVERMAYGNGSSVHYGYDGFKRLISTRYDDEAEPRYRYDYDANGAIARLTDAPLGRTILRENDFANRPARLIIHEDGKHHYTEEVSYDGASRVSALRSLVGAEKVPYRTEFAYDSEDRPTIITYDVPEYGVMVRYDSLGRVISRKLMNDADGYLTRYDYAQGGYSAGSTTNLISQIVQPGQSFEYVYDVLGNITRESRNGLETTYVYDGLSQLVRVNDPHEGKTTTFAYDRGGNMLSRKVYALEKGDLPETPLEEVAYAYEDANWKDKVTAIGGAAIAYDAIGNPLEDGTWRYAWDAGRQLASMARGDGDAVETLRFKYNADGLRVMKGTDGSVTRYVLSGKKIVHLTRETKGDAPEKVEMHFWYDDNGNAAMCKFQGQRYGYVHNIHGDVVALVDLENNASEVVAYTYDAWGKPTGCTGSMADTLGVENPFRYRGYVYDEETGLYYLRSRFYCPVWGRFLNADSLLTGNMFAYCVNNPVNRADASGTLSFSSLFNTIKSAAKAVSNAISKVFGPSSASAQSKKTSEPPTVKRQETYFLPREGPYDMDIIRNTSKVYEYARTMYVCVPNPVPRGSDNEERINTAIVRAKPVQDDSVAGRIYHGTKIDVLEVWTDPTTGIDWAVFTHEYENGYQKTLLMDMTFLRDDFYDLNTAPFEGDPLFWMHVNNNE